jgi:hypothetical protein
LAGGQSGESTSEGVGKLHWLTVVWFWGLIREEGNREVLVADELELGSVSPMAGAGFAIRGQGVAGAHVE